MAIKKRKVPGAALTSVAGPEWKKALGHRILQDFAKYENYDISYGAVEAVFLKSKAMRAVPALDCSEKDHVFIHLLASILYHEYGSSLLTDRAYRRLDTYIFFNIGSKFTSLTPVGRGSYITELYFMRKEVGHRHHKSWDRLSFINGLTLGKGLQTIWRRRPSKIKKLSS